MIRFAVIVVALGCCFGLPSRAEAVNPALAYGAKFCGEYLAGKGLDLLWESAFGSDEARIKELDQRLVSYATLLRQVDEKQAAKIEQLRRDLSTKTTAAQVREIVNQTLAALSDRVKGIEARVDKLDDRVKQIEELFGYIPTVPPAPLLMSSVEKGEPAAHPLTLEWLKLLCRSEQSRLKLLELRREFADTAEKVKGPLREDTGILEETAKLHEKVKAEMAKRLFERQELLREYRPNSVTMIEFDDKLASVTWLMAVTKPLSSGEFMGRLVPPAALLGSQASDVIIAFKLAGADSALVAGLYKQLLSTESVSTSVYEVAVDRSLLSREMVSVGDKALAISTRGMGLVKAARTNDQVLKAALKDFSSRHEAVIRLRRDRQALLTQFQKLTHDIDAALDSAVRSFVAAAETERPTNPRMLAYRRGVLEPLCAWRRVVDSTDWQSEVAKSVTWDRVVGCQRLPPGVGELHGNGKFFRFVAVSEDSRTVVLADEFDVQLSDAAGTEKQTLRPGRLDKGISALCITRDGKRLVTGHENGTVQIWDATTGKMVHRISAHVRHVNCLSLSSDGNRLISVGGIAVGKDEPKIWAVASGTLEFTLPQRDGYRYRQAHFSANGSHFVAADGGQLQVWDAAAQKAATSFASGHFGNIYCVCYASAKNVVATGSEDGTIRIWDAGNGKELHCLRGHDKDIRHVCLSSDGKRVASANGDDTVRVWDTTSGQEVLRFNDQHAGPGGICFSNDGRLFIAGSQKSILILDLDAELEKAALKRQKP